jgi:hypothetical protein
MSAKVDFAFGPQAIVVSIHQILPLRKLPDDIETSIKYKRIRASLREVGLIEPLIVFPQRGAAGCYMLLDGAIRLNALKDLGHKEVLCLVGTEDETYTYNQKINQMTPIQEHFMILKALDSGVPEQRIAATLDIDVSRVREKRNLLAGICPEAVELIKDRHISAAGLRELKRVTPMRQIEMIELMIGMDNYTLSYAKCLYTATPDEQKIEEHRPKDNHGIRPEEASKMQHELETLGRDFKTIQDTFGENVLHLVPIVGYLKKVLSNPRVAKVLGHRYADILSHFQHIVRAPDLETAA